MGPAATLIGIIGVAVRVLVWLILIDAVLTWFPQVDRRHPAVMLLRRITEPIYRPIQRLVPPSRTGGLDLSPLIAILGLQIIWAVIRAVLASGMRPG